MRTLLLTGLLLLAIPPAAAAQVAPQIVLADPAAAALAPVRNGDVRVGSLVVERAGDRVLATTRFRGRAPARKVTLCVTVGAREQCVRRRPRDGIVRFERSGPFEQPLVARTRWGGARGVVRM